MPFTFDDAIKIGIGLQKVDNLSVSQYFLNLVNESNPDHETFLNIREKLLNHYKNNHSRTFEADLSSLNIASFLMNNDSFSLDCSMLKNIHQYIFQDIFENAGNYRSVNIYKNEAILRGDTIIYSDFREIGDTLEYEFNKEKAFNYKGLSKVATIKHVSKFISSLWQIHPYREGNTRTIALFLIEYLQYLGFSMSIDPFYLHSDYFRNILVRDNYDKVKPDKSYLYQFICNLVFNESNPMDNSFLIIK